MGNESHKVLVIGASGGIAQAIIAGKTESSITAVSSKPEPHGSLCKQWFTTDYSESSIETIYKQLCSNENLFHEIYICNGQLHNENHMPEKRLKDISLEQLQEIFHSNLLIPALWLKHMPELLVKKSESTLTVFSARVGSISDNRLGGWYSYRASKAALNMLVKTASIELQRQRPKARVICFHPGTTDTSLSAPFQKNVKPEKLFTPSFVASQLNKLVSRDDLENGFYDWAHNQIDW